MPREGPKKGQKEKKKKKKKQMRSKMVSFLLTHQAALALQILHAMGKISEDEIWQSEPESVVGYVFFS